MSHTHQIKTLINEPYLSRGQEYYQDGMVQLTSIASNAAKAKVVGTRVYKVTLTLNNSQLDGECNCPSYTDFGPCKHMAATAFAIIASQNGGYHASSQSTHQVAEFEEFENFLKKKTKLELIDIILDLSEGSPDVIYELMGYQT